MGIMSISRRADEHQRAVSRPVDEPRWAGIGGRAVAGAWVACAEGPAAGRRRAVPGPRTACGGARGGAVPGALDGLRRRAHEPMSISEPSAGHQPAGG